MEIVIGCDHRGYKLKERVKAYLEKSGFMVKDFGCFSERSVDYSDIGKLLARNISDGVFGKGILICGSGIGMSITANRFKNVRAALCRNAKDAEMSRKHNNSNILVLGSDFVELGSVGKVLDTWLDTKFEGGRHERRLNKIDDGV